MPPVSTLVGASGEKSFTTHGNQLSVSPNKRDDSMLDGASGAIALTTNGDQPPVSSIKRNDSIGASGEKSSPMTGDQLLGSPNKRKQSVRNDTSVSPASTVSKPTSKNQRSGSFSDDKSHSTDSSDNADLMSDKEDSDMRIS